jgi:hypothetical protein
MNNNHIHPLLRIRDKKVGVQITKVSRTKAHKGLDTINQEMTIIEMIETIFKMIDTNHLITIVDSLMIKEKITITELKDKIIEFMIEIVREITMIGILMIEIIIIETIMIEIIMTDIMMNIDHILIIGSFIYSIFRSFNDRHENERNFDKDRYDR